MTRFRTLSLLAVSLSLALTGCADDTSPSTAAPGAPMATAATTAADLAPLRKDIGNGLYEIVFDNASSSLFVAATPSRKAGDGGLLYQLDPQTLDVRREIKLDRGAFALGLDAVSGTLYVGNTLDGSVTAVDTATGATRGLFQLGTPDADGNAPHTRKVIVDGAGKRLFVTNPEEGGKVWIVDSATGTVLHTLDNLGKWPTGAAYDAEHKRLYVGMGDTREIAVIDPDTGTVVSRFDSGEPDAHYFINLAVDPATQRVFASDSKADQLLAIDGTTGTILKRVEIGTGALDVLFNPARNEIYVTNRGVSRAKPDGAGRLTVIDATSYVVKRALDLAPHPNSLALSADGDTLFVSVKNGRGQDTPEGVVRIALD